MESRHESYEDYMKRKMNEFEDRASIMCEKVAVLNDRKEHDMVNSPAHYADGKIETIDYIVDVLGEYEAISYCQGNVIKYTGSRLWKKGNPIQDAKKAVWYLNKMIELLEKTKGVNW
jgi:hypothetical protein